MRDSMGSGGVMKARCVLAFAFVLACVAGLGCSSIQVNVDFDPGEDFTVYETFDWLPQLSKRPGDYRLDNPLVEKRVMAAVERTLAAKGFEKVADTAPDFYVAHFFTVEQKLDVYTVNNSYYGGYGWGISSPRPACVSTTRAR